MTIDVFEEYLFLMQAPLPESETAITTRSLPLTVEDREIRLGVDHRGLRHLLVPLSTPDLTPDNTSRGVALRKRVMVVDGLEQPFADLVCLKASLGLVFEHVVDDAVTRLAASTEESAVVCRRVLADWRELLQAATSEIGREAVLGLVGELEVLRQLTLADPERALDAWVGPSGTVNDFVTGSRAVEVKATAGVDGNLIHVSNVDQLDPAFSDELLLVVVHCKESAGAPSLDARVRDLLELGVDRVGLMQRLAKVGYVFEAGLHVPNFAVRSMRLWPVSEDFPGLRSQDIPPSRRAGVSQVSYMLDLDAAPFDPVSGTAVQVRLQEWLG